MSVSYTHLNANKYTFVWSKTINKNEAKMFEKISTLVEEINEVEDVYKRQLSPKTWYSINHGKDNTNATLVLGFSPLVLAKIAECCKL